MLISLVHDGMLASDLQDMAWVIALLVFGAISAVAEKLKQRGEEKKRQQRRPRPPEVKPPTPARPTTQRSERPQSADQRPTAPQRPAARPVPPVQRSAPPQARPARPVPQRPAPPRAKPPRPVPEPQAEQVIEAIEIVEESVFAAKRKAKEQKETHHKETIVTRRKTRRTALGSFNKPSRRELRRAIIWSEILRPPLALREPGESESLWTR